MRSRRVLASAACVALVFVLADCSSASSATTTTASTTSTLAPTTSTTTTTTAPTTTSSTTSTTTSTSSAAGSTCVRASLAVKAGRSSGAAGTIALGFVVSNAAAASCTLDGFPGITLVPVSGTVHPAVSHLGSASLVTLGGGGRAGFVLEYSDVPVNGETSCPKIASIDVALPSVAGAAIPVAARFCPYGQPSIRVSAVLSTAKYLALLR